MLDAYVQRHKDSSPMFANMARGLLVELAFGADVMVGRAVFGGTQISALTHLARLENLQRLSHNDTEIRDIGQLASA